MKRYPENNIAASYFPVDDVLAINKAFADSTRRQQSTLEEYVAITERRFLFDFPKMIRKAYGYNGKSKKWARRRGKRAEQILDEIYMRDKS